jgi:hypothetical protein
MRPRFVRRIDRLLFSRQVRQDRLEHPCLLLRGNHYHLVGFWRSDAPDWVWSRGNR